MRLLLERARQVANGDPVAVAEDHGVLDDVVELAHVALPRQRHEELQGRAVDALEVLLQLAVVHRHEVLDERRDVLAALAQRRNLDAEDVEPVVEIVAERALCHDLREVAVGGGDDAHVDLDRRRRADRQDLLRFDGAQQLHLQVERQIADLVEEDRAAARALEQAFLVGDRAGEGAAQVAEELALEQTLGNGAAVDGQKDLVARLAEVVDGARDDLLARRRSRP